MNIVKQFDSGAAEVPFGMTAASIVSLGRETGDTVDETEEVSETATDPEIEAVAVLGAELEDWGKPRKEPSAIERLLIG